MKRYLIILFFFPTFLLAQTPKIDSIINNISFKQDTIQSVFEWVVNNIEYDLQRFENRKKIGTYLIINEQQKINNTLLTGEGVCEDYALVFNILVRKLGYTSYTVDGYTKDMNKIVKDFGHAWNVIKIKGKWYCFDTTWSSKTTGDKVFDGTWFKVDPTEFLLTHVPYDPIWQLNECPVVAKTNNAILPINEYFNFEDSIQLYQEPQSIISIQKLIHRISKYSDKNENVNQYLEILNETLNTRKHNKAIEIFNDVVSSFNAYIHYRNSRFQKHKLKNSEIKELLISMQKKILEANALLTNVLEKNGSDKKDMSDKISELDNKINQELILIKKRERVLLFIKGSVR